MNGKKTNRPPMPQKQTPGSQHDVEGDRDVAPLTDREWEQVVKRGAEARANDSGHLHGAGSYDPILDSEDRR